MDRAALDFAHMSGIPVGGWCPAGRRSEDIEIPESYPLIETSGRQYPQRTRKNVKDSDATLIFYFKELSGGTLLTRESAQKYCKSWFCYDLSGEEKIESILVWLDQQKPKIINIAGPRESERPGIHSLTIEILSKIFISSKSKKRIKWPPDKPKNRTLDF